MLRKIAVFPLFVLMIALTQPGCEPQEEICSPPSVPDGKGGCVQCTKDLHCADGYSCKNNQCALNYCANPVNTGDLGPCEAFFGWFWNGAECAQVSGCPCSDNDTRKACKFRFKSKESCEKATTSCTATPLRWYEGCGTPVCYAEYPPDSTPKCEGSQQLGNPCQNEGQLCDAGFSCGAKMICAKEKPVACPKSQRKVKRSISYLSESDLQRYYKELLGTRLATYEYKNAKVIGTRHLGFIIDDTPTQSMMVNGKRERVDLYGYTSMTVAGLKVQAQQLKAMQTRLDSLARQVDALNSALKQCLSR